MKLFLASSLDQTVDLLTHKIPDIKGKKVLFIENAADNEKGDKWWIKLDREAFEKVGCEIVNVDLREISKADFENKIEEAFIAHFCGGSVLYLIYLMKERGFDQIIVDAVKNNKIIYTGTSAGSMIVAKDLSLNKFDPEEGDEKINLKDFSGLGLVNFMIIPHVGNKDFVEGNKKIIEQLPNFKESLLILYDNQVVWVEDNKIEILNR